MSARQELSPFPIRCRLQRSNEHSQDGHFPGKLVTKDLWSQEITMGRARGKSERLGEKPAAGGPLHTQEPVTVASFRTWRGWRECVARDRCLTGFDSNIAPPSSVVSTIFRPALRWVGFPSG